MVFAPRNLLLMLLLGAFLPAAHGIQQDEFFQSFLPVLKHYPRDLKRTHKDTDLFLKTALNEKMASPKKAEILGKILRKNQRRARIRIPQAIQKWVLSELSAIEKLVKQAYSCPRVKSLSCQNNPMAFKKAATRVAQFRDDLELYAPLSALETPADIPKGPVGEGK